jgi:hypothetical protein
MVMGEEIKRALVRSAAKLGIGLGLLAAVIGIRIVTATPRGVESEIAKLDRFEQATASETPDTASPAPAATPAESDSLVDRLSTTLREGLPKSDPGARDGDKLVSCRLATGMHYMRADDCATRGGTSTVFVDEP